MLATHWPFTPTHQAQHAYIPTRPSPLSPRSANAPSRPLFTRYAMSKSTFSSSDSENATPFSKRAVKSNPLFAEKRRSPDEQRERRRDIFMKKVEQGREDKKWAGRTDQVRGVTRCFTEGGLMCFVVDLENGLSDAEAEGRG